MERKKIRSFTDLNAWKEAYKLVIMIYGETESFPKKEMFGLTSQMRRAAVSVASNIAEGFCRFSNKDKYQFYTISHSSLIELQNQSLIARGLKYLGSEGFDKIAGQTIAVAKLISGIKKNKKPVDIQDTKY